MKVKSRNASQVDQVLVWQFGSLILNGVWVIIVVCDLIEKLEDEQFVEDVMTKFMWEKVYVCTWTWTVCPSWKMNSTI